MPYSTVSQLRDSQRSIPGASGCALSSAVMHRTMIALERGSFFCAGLDDRCSGNICEPHCVSGLTASCPAGSFDGLVRC